MNSGLSKYCSRLIVAELALIFVAVGFGAHAPMSLGDIDGLKLRKKEYLSKFGAMAPSPEGLYRVFAESTFIYKEIGETHAHGFEVIRKDRDPFMGGFEIRFPSPIKVTPELERAFTVLEGGLVIRSESKLRHGIYTSPFWFSEDDPTGTYELTIFIDSEEYRRIDYDVLEAQASLPF